MSEAAPSAEDHTPAEWRAVPFEKLLSSNGVEKRPSIPRSEFQPSGPYPVVDQGQGLIAGFTDSESAIHRSDLPIILFGDHTRAVKYIDFPFAAGADGTKLLRPVSPDLDAQFLYYLLLATELPSRGYNRHFGLLREREFPVPTEISEQKAIARLLVKLQRSVGLQEQAVTAVKELKAATMVKLFREGLRGERLKQTEIGEIPGSWQVVPFESVFAVQQGKAVSPHSRLGIRARRFLRTVNVLWGRMDLSDPDQMDFSEEESARLSLRNGDLLVCEGGDVGRTAIWEMAESDWGFQNHLHRARRKTDKTNPRFFMYWMQNAMLQRGLYLSEANRTTIPNLSASRLRSLPVPKPPDLSEQDKIATTILAIERRERVAELSRGLRTEVFSNMLATLMAGRLRIASEEAS